MTSLNSSASSVTLAANSSFCHCVQETAVCMMVWCRRVPIAEKDATPFCLIRFEAFDRDHYSSQVMPLTRTTSSQGMQ